MLRASIPTTIEMRQNITSDSRVLDDPTRIHQVIMNLCTNAYYAIARARVSLSTGKKIWKWDAALI